MADAVGKKFEATFKACWLESMPDSFIYRLPDQMSGYKTTSRNICDFICYTKGKMFLIECKTTKGTSFPFTRFSQYEAMSKVIDKPGIIAGIVLWFYEHDCILFVPIKSIKHMLDKGEKSFKFKWVDKDDCEYDFKVIPGVKKRFFITSDYSVLLEEDE